MSASSNFRFPLAAAALLLLFAGAYEAAVRWPGRPLTAAAGRASEVATADSSAFVGPAVPDTLPQPATPTPAAAPVATPEPYRDPRPVFERGSPAARRPRLLRRYVGTVGGQPATALLDWQNPDSIQGSFYLHRRGPAYSLTQPLPNSAQPRRPRQGQVLEVVPTDGYEPNGRWQLRGRPGATLTGTWRDGPTGRPQAVILREDYTGAVRLAVQTEWVHGRFTPDDLYGHTHSSVAWVEYEFLHLLAPAAVVPALHPVLSPGPAARRRLLLNSGDVDCETSYRVTVRLNDFGLLGYQYFVECSPLGGRYSKEFRNALLDLQAGRRLAPESQLLPHYQAGLARLLARHMLRDPIYQPIKRDTTWRRHLIPYLGARHDTLAAATRWLLAGALPDVEQAVFTGAGLEIEDLRDEYIRAMQDLGFTWFIPYRELRPLVRPGTPLARMLQARGMW